MPTNTESVRRLAEQVGGFHLRDGSMRRAQKRIVALLARSEEPPQRELDAYTAEVGRYFAAFEREARAHLKDVEKRLSQVGQVQFNLTAERGVAQRRIEITRSVLVDLESMNS